MFGSDVKLRLFSVPFNPMFVRFTLVTYMKCSSHAIPSQLLHELLPFHEDSKVWLWLSRLDFHSNKALASLLCKVEEPTIEEEVVMSVQKHIEKNTQNGTHFMNTSIGNLGSRLNQDILF
jgi:hypothetical protein